LDSEPLPPPQTATSPTNRLQAECLMLMRSGNHQICPMPPSYIVHWAISLLNHFRMNRWTESRFIRLDYMYSVANTNNCVYALRSNQECARVGICST
jgi:hypothetical protein